MPIRSIPFRSVTVAHIEDLIRRGIREDRTLDYKETINLDDREAKFEFLKDISAMANASGGTIIYGAVEGDGEDRGLIVGIRSLPIEPDRVSNSIDNLLRDCIDERISGVLHREIAGNDGNYLYIIRVPSSPLAPHMVTNVSTTKPRFYLRANTTNDPMNARQIKEVVLRAETALERAKHLVEQRTAVLRDRAPLRRNMCLIGANAGTNQAILHVVSLFPPIGAWDLGADPIKARLQRVLAFGAEETYTDPRYTADGLVNVFDGVRHVLFLRVGAIEFQEFDIVATLNEGARALAAWRVERDVAVALRECVALTEDGLLALPVLVSLRLLDVGESGLQPRPRDPIVSRRSIGDPEVWLEPIVISTWGVDADAQVHRMLDEMWQSWGLQRSGNYDQDGTLREYDERGHRIQRYRLD